MKNFLISAASGAMIFTGIKTAMMSPEMNTLASGFTVAGVCFLVSTFTDA